MNFFLEKNWRIFLNFFRPLAKFFWPSVLNFPAWCQTWILRVQKEHFEEEKFYWKNKGFLTFLNFERNTFYAFCQKNIIGVVKPEFTYPWNFLREQKTLKMFFFTIFGHWSRNFRLFVQTFLAGYSKLQSTCPPDRFDVKFFPERNMIFQFFWTLMAEFLCFLLKLFWRGCENCSSLVQRNTLMKNESFFDKKWRNFLKLFRLWTKIFWPSVLSFSARCQTWILRVDEEYF